METLNLKRGRKRSINDDEKKDKKKINLEKTKERSKELTKLNKDEFQKYIPLLKEKFKLENSHLKPTRKGLSLRLSIEDVIKLTS